MTARRRALFLDQYGDVGGGQTVLLSLVRAALRECDEVTVLAPSGPLESVLREEFGDRVMYSRCATPALSHGRKTIADVGAILIHVLRLALHLPLLRRQDIIYVNGLRHLPALFVLAPVLHTAIVYHVHLDHSALEKGLIRRAARSPHTYRIVVNSPFVQGRLGAAPEKTVLVENALDRRFAGRAFCDRFSNATGPRQAAVCGTLRPEKGQDIAIQALETRSDMTLHVIGKEGDGAASWVAALKRSVGPRLHFHGVTQDLPGLLDRLGVQFNIVPSCWEEPFGLVAIEGMACSCLTIVSGTGGLADIAARTGALVARDAQQLTAVLDQLAAKPPRELAEIARAQFEATQATYAPDRFESQIRSLFRAAFAHRRGSL
jgi:glycosyltransferase involved in cell wall biosynthesis